MSIDTIIFIIMTGIITLGFILALLFAIFYVIYMLSPLGNYLSKKHPDCFRSPNEVPTMFDNFFN